MGLKAEHPAKGWAASYGRESDIRDATRATEAPENQDRVNRHGALLHGFRIKPGYEFSDHGMSGSKDVRRPDVERAIKWTFRNLDQGDRACASVPGSRL